METDKLYAAVIGALAAFICTKAYDALSKRRYRYNLHRCLREELVSVLDSLQAAREILENKIEIKIICTLESILEKYKHQFT
ncbi:hypothetical protein, partial [Vibrio jasicida]|uniref:hypothetical protein n=1 Tax=Vibrio jasicida TaxID=766224 RepID=UPI0011B0D7D0